MLKKYRVSLLFLLVLTIGLVGLVAATDEEEKQGIVINEICSNNFSIAGEIEEVYDDYIELYNGSDETIILDNYYLSDDKEQLQKYSLEGKSILPKGFLVVWLTDYGDERTQDGIFGVSNQGEAVYLVQVTEEEKVRDSVYVPKLEYDTSYGRNIDGEGVWQNMTASPGESNETAERVYAKELAAPEFSVESGFYEDEFFLELRAGLGETIYYTLDGNEPNINSLKYTGKIKISDASVQENVLANRTDLCPYTSYTPDYKVDKATVVRAITYNKTTDKVSDIATEVYFVGYEAKKEYEDFPIISLVTDTEHLFDPERGIYTNGIKLEEYNRECQKFAGEVTSKYVDDRGIEHHRYEASNAFNDGKEWEREGTLTYFDNYHEFRFKQDVGIRIAGASTRGTAQKSFNIYGRDIYDDTVIFPYDFFDGCLTSDIKIRNGGSLNSDIKIVDAFLASLVEDRNVSVQRSKPCILFLNGEYWGIYNIRERYKEEYITSYYGIAEENIWMIDDSRAKVGGQEAQDAYHYFVAMATECDLVYDDVYEMVSSLIDVQSFIDFCCINMYTGNTDMYDGHNIAMWRSAENDGTAYGDTKWRWMVFDLDQTLKLPANGVEPKEWLGNSLLMQDPIVQNFMKNEQFKKQFCITFMDIANVNFNYDKTSQKWNQWKEIYGEQLLINNKRFFEGDYSKEWLDERFKEVDDYFKMQFPYAMDALKDTVGLNGDLVPVKIETNLPEAGSVKINTSVLKNIDVFEGKYYTDYPIVLTAAAEEGYRFVGWEGDICSSEDCVEINLSQEEIQVQAVFEKINDY